MNGIPKLATKQIQCLQTLCIHDLIHNQKALMTSQSQQRVVILGIFICMYKEQCTLASMIVTLTKSHISIQVKDPPVLDKACSYFVFENKLAVTIQYLPMRSQPQEIDLVFKLWMQVLLENKMQNHKKGRQLFSIASEYRIVLSIAYLLLVRVSPSALPCFESSFYNSPFWAFEQRILLYTTTL